MIWRSAMSVGLWVVAAGITRAASAGAAGAAANTEPDRYALVIGANQGGPKEAVLRFAESDAHRIADALRSVGHFRPPDVAVLTDVTADEVRSSLIELNARIRQSTAEVMLFVFYSGHADGVSLHLGGTNLPFGELRDLVAGSSASARVLVIDACRSGALTRVKGGHPGPSFEVPFERPMISAKGLAILASSAALEDSQESDDLGGSFFTHYFVSALLGAADRNDDNKVTLGEAYAYTADRTIAATSVSFEGPQHPTFRFDLGGRDDLVLTHFESLRGGFGLLSFSEPGEYLVQREAEGGPPVAEISLSGSAVRALALGRGAYHVTRRGSDYLLQGEFAVVAGAKTVVGAENMQRVAYARVVRKGGTKETMSWSMSLLGGLRGALLDLGVAWQTAIGARVDFPDLSVELRLGLGGAATQNHRLEIDTRELDVSLLGFRTFDLGPIGLALGVEVGALRLTQRFGDPETEDRASTGMFFGPVGAVEVPTGRWYARAEAGAMTYILRVGPDNEMAERSTPITYRTSISAGVYF